MTVYDYRSEKDYSVSHQAIQEEFSRWRNDTSRTFNYSIECNTTRFRTTGLSEVERAVTVRFTHPMDGNERTLTVSRFDRAVDNIGVLAMVLHDMRLNEKRLGPAYADLMRQAYAALPAPTTKRDPYEVLGVRPDATKQDIDDMYKLKARRLHPDVGGSQEAMAELNEAYAAVKRR